MMKWLATGKPSAAASSLYFFTTGASSGARSTSVVAGNTARTAALFQEMSQQDVRPDTNTVNAHLSGCLRAGDVPDAHRAFTKMTAEWGAEPDFVTYKRQLQMLSRGLRLDAQAGRHTPEAWQTYTGGSKLCASRRQPQPLGQQARQETPTVTVVAVRWYE